MLSRKYEITNLHVLASSSAMTTSITSQQDRIDEADQLESLTLYVWADGYHYTVMKKL
jgi:hypothetical protein